ncbi:MAG: restriction endonuclease [Candidatus Acidiferrales bacterium]
MAQYVVRRINAEKTPELERAVKAKEQITSSMIDLIKSLFWHDFETLVDLVFSTSGWRRQGDVGKTQKTLDIDLILPSTGERAMVQIKSKTTSNELAEYVGKTKELGSYNRMFYVYHSGEAETDADRVTVIGPEMLAEMVLDAGLVNWIIRKTS